MEKDAEIIQKGRITCVRGSHTVTLQWISIICPVITCHASAVLQGHRMTEWLRWEGASGDCIA